jgi:hypothetical protein
VLSLAWRVDEEIGAYSCGQIHVFQVVVAYFHSFFALLYFKRNNQNELLLKDRQENAIFYTIYSIIEAEIGPYSRLLSKILNFF